ncbi:VOC family protein [Nesterenkonia cremea]|uniref:Glyoxalase n=1 Tax=Nesterenkonia cremea TaxID=1882340 RepID=A0A917EQU5_9MICC|nr:VOC family protein [Nesterenkonia cremea]GGE74482.1 glyoxalase [Nesterenkonia cremea]
MSIRAIEHIGITVPDIEQATEFFSEALGAEKIYDMLDEPLAGPAVEAGLGIPEGATIEAIRMMRLGEGPNLELFSYSGTAQRQAVRPSDYGIQHFCVYVDDIYAAAARLESAGGTLLSQPNDLPGGDAGSGNRYLYARTPWGSTMELVTYPSSQAYEPSTEVRRWRPARASDHRHQMP